MSRIFTKDESITIRISGNNCSLTSTYSPVINIHGDSEIALLCLQIGNNVEKFKKKKILIDETNNGIRLTRRDVNSLPVDIRIPAGVYEIEDINNYITNYFEKNTTLGKLILKLSISDDHMKCRIDSNHNIDFNIENSIGSTLGFEKKLYSYFQERNLYHQSQNNIQYELIGYGIDVNSIKVLCNIAKGSFENGQHSNSIYEVFPKLLETRLVETPTNLIYYKLNTAVIKKIKIDLVDEENNPIKNLNEKITVLLRIRPRKF